MLKEILILYQIGLRNLTSSSICILTCFEHLNDLYIAKLDPKWVEVEIAKLPPDLKTTKDVSKFKKKKRKKPEEIITKEVQTKASKKRAKPTSSSSDCQGTVLETVDLTSSAEEGFQQPSTISSLELTSSVESQKQMLSNQQQ
ncbi:hypothetical protein D8674_010430 [Pyrus ussuriensis x Pyrus communis]|uniref:Uncharacterized protein n=1 Tax=Pyrus ussuriensis x Pyrus communis TaxID=2448454 RepID=A0A5N5FAQ4_9ROSA|nr:hypothetical protein D8674_010430 [Pyrus ussuriensis x Pyrus communis]